MILFIIITLFQNMVSSMLLKIDKDGFQRQIFYTSRVLRGAESQYPNVEKKVFYDGLRSSKVATLCSGL